MNPFAGRLFARARHLSTRCADCGRRMEPRAPACRHCGGTRRVRPARHAVLRTLGAVGSVALALTAMPLRRLRRGRTGGRS
jgi:DNA-directed RNA polymerase subunit RPC12/RpoP